MAITLVTGLPGHGKTLYALWRWKAEAADAGRPVFHNSIPDLNILGWQPWDVQKWEELPAGSILVVDEAQFAFPVTGRGQTPQWVQNLATHRHKGIDLVVITQDPMLLDSFVRRLVDRHFHVVRKFGLQWATVHEFTTGARDNVAKNRKDSIRHEFKYPKEIFGLYKSAELHTVKRRIPARVYILLAMPVLALAAGGYGWHLLQRPMTPAGPAAAPGQAAASAPGGVDAGRREPPPVGRWDRGSDRRRTPVEYAADYTPRVAGLAHTAPIYDEVTRPREAPYPAACVVMRNTCRCYSQQATRLETPADLCKQIAEGGFFMAWGQPVAQAVPMRQAEPVGQVAPQPVSFGFDAGRRAAPAAQPIDQATPPQVEPARPPVRPRPPTQDPKPASQG